MVYSALALGFLLGLASLSVDWGRVVTARAELQQAADSAARYAAAGLPLGITEVQTRAAASIAQNKCDGVALSYNSADVEFGVWNQATKSFVVLTGAARTSATAVRVTAARDATHGSALSLVFGKVIGRPTMNISASSIVARGKPATIAIDGDSCPWLAGASNGTKVAATDDNPTPSVAPAQSPTAVNGISLTPGHTIVFRQASGKTSYTDAADYGPDGNTDWIVEQQAVNGINKTKAPLNAMVAIFLDDRTPNTYAQGVAGDFSSPSSRDFSTLAPPLKQVFFVGDGLNSAGNLQQFVVPAGATRMYLGIMDEKGWWWDNTGTLSTTIMDDKLTTVR
jgi:Flp pilus assembly protein TadG